MIKKDCMHCASCKNGGYFCEITGETDEDMICSECKHYHKPMVFYVDELPCSCSQEDCAFNYDELTCRAVAFLEGRWDYPSDDKELDECLSGNGKRYSKCPLRLISELNNQGEINDKSDR